MTTMRACAVCGNDFESVRGVKVCSDPCHRKRAAAQARAWCAANPKKARTMAVNEMQRRKDQRRARGLKKPGPAKVAKVAKLRPCANCGTAFEPMRGAKSCSAECRRLRSVAQSKAAQAKALTKPTRPCVICGGVLPAGMRLACSVECQRKRANQRYKKWRQANNSNPDDPPVDWEGEYIFEMTPRRARLLKLFERFNRWHFESPV
jgi:predicted nucleic acid-binding Zn ribbon protein